MFAIRAGHLIDGTGQAPIKGAVVLLNGERIVDVGPAQSLAIPDGCLVVDATEYTVMPGLIDAHVHITTSGRPEDVSGMSHVKDSVGLLALKGYVHVQRELLAGFTTVRDCGARSYTNLAVRDAIELGLVAGPRIVACGLPICSTGGHFDGDGNTSATIVPQQAAVVDSPNEARAVVRQQFKMGADFIKIACDSLMRGLSGPFVTRQEFSLAEMEAICETAHESGLRVAAHAQGGPGMLDAIRAGVDSVEHMQGYTEEDMELIAAHGVVLVPTLTTARRVVDTGLVAHIPQHKRERALKFMRQNWKDKLAALKRALAAGVRIAVGTDSGYSNCLHGQNAYELELLVEGGMTPMQAVVAATSMAAECLGLGHELGTLRKGYYADILIVNGDPLADISLLREAEHLKAVYKGGQLVKDDLNARQA